MEITEFLTYDNIGLMTQIIISGLVVMATTQAFKSVVDRLIKFISRGKIKKIKTKDLTLIISILQVICVMYGVNHYPLDFTSIWLVVVNSVLLYLGCTSGFDTIFKNITIKKEGK